VPRSKPEVQDDPGACKRRALDLLARREHSRRELERKLAARGYPDGLVGQTLDELEVLGALVAARFTESFIRARVSRGKGPVRIRAELAELGVDAARGAEQLRDANVDWVAEARAARLKRFGVAPPHDFKERARQARFLQARGFTSAHIAAALGSDASGVESSLDGSD
jgi:regulatory protein